MNTKLIPVIEPQSGLSYHIGCKLISWVGMLFHVPIDFEPLAMPGDRVTGYVNCPHCKTVNLVTVSLFNESKRKCHHCYQTLSLMNDGSSIWNIVEL